MLVGTYNAALQWVGFSQAPTSGISVDNCIDHCTFTNFRSGIVADGTGEAGPVVCVGFRGPGIIFFF